MTLYFPAFVFALGGSIATPAIPVFAKSFDTGFGVASLVTVMHALGGLAATVPSGFLVDRFVRRVILIAAPLLMALSSGLTALAGSFSQLLAYRFIGGAAMEMWRQARLAMVADVGKQHQRGRQITGMVGTESSGRLIGPAIGGVLATWSIQVPFVAHSLLSLVAIVPSLFLLRESAPGLGRRVSQDSNGELSSRDLIALMFDRRYRGFFCAQLFASMTRGVLWGGRCCSTRRSPTISVPRGWAVWRPPQHRRYPDHALLRLSDGSLRSQNHYGAGLPFDGSRVIFLAASASGTGV